MRPKPPILSQALQLVTTTVMTKVIGTIKTPMVKTSKAHKPLMVKTFTLKTMGDKSREISPKTVIIMMVTRVSVLLIVMLDEEQVYGST